MARSMMSNVDFVDDRFQASEGIIGTNRVTNMLANNLVTGTAGGTISGRVFNDANRDGRDIGESGLAGVTVFADVDGNGLLDPTDPSSVTAADGSYSLSVTPGTFNVIALTPSQFVGTTVLSQSATIGLGGAVTDVDFGFNQIIADITGRVVANLNNDDILAPSEPGIAGIYVFLDLDGDDRPDLGEPGDVSAEDGTYTINFPGPGEYTIRAVVEPGFEINFPESGEHVVNLRRHLTRGKF